MKNAFRDVRKISTTILALVFCFALGSHIISMAIAQTTDRQAVLIEPWSEEEITFANGEVILAGTLLVPRSEGLRPALVFVHGDGPQTRKPYRIFAEHFARHGIAALIYDKRGTGASTGSWLPASLNELANDALAAVHYLQKRDNINSEQVGLWGGNQPGGLDSYHCSFPLRRRSVHHSCVRSRNESRKTTPLLV